MMHYSQPYMGNGKNNHRMMLPENSFQSGPMEASNASHGYEDQTWPGRCSKNSCPNFASIFCPRCESVAYCCEPHRQEEEIHHKGDCFPETNFTFLHGPLDYSDKMIMSSCAPSPSHSSFYFASTNNFNPGDTVCKICPKMMAPHDKDLPGPSSDSCLCLGCCKWFPINSYKCSKCSWPVCSYNCENNPLHASYECNTFQACKIPCVFFQGMYDVLLALRCILLFVYDQEFWKAFQNWNSFMENQSRPSLVYVDTAVKFLLKDCRIGSDFYTAESLRNVLYFLHYNSLCQETRVSVYDLQDVRNYHSAKYVYPYKHIYGRHCNPNVNWTINFALNLKEANLHLFAVQSLKVGDKLNACFQTTFPEYGTLERRHLHRQQGQSVCYCDRCIDPTELNSCASAVKCQKCSDGHLLPLDPLADQSQWVCSNSNCRHHVEPLTIVNKFFRISKDICEAKNDLAGLLKILKKLGSILHTHHYLIAQAANHIVEIGWLNVRTKLIASFKEFDFLPYLKAGQICLTFADKVSPGLTTHRAKYVYFLQMMSGISEVQNALYYHQNMMLVEGRVSRENFEVIHLYQKHCQKILLRKKIGTQEYEWMESLSKSSDDLAELLRVTVRQRPFDNFNLERLQKAFSYFCSQVYQPNLPSELHVDLGPVIIERELKPSRLEYKTFFGF